jgi:hypothetical protein
LTRRGGSGEASLSVRDVCSSDLTVGGKPGSRISRNPDGALGCRCEAGRRKEHKMDILFTVIAIAFVLVVLALVGFALFEMTPFASHRDHFRDPRTGKRRWESPHLD